MTDEKLGRVKASPPAHPNLLPAHEELPGLHAIRSGEHKIGSRALQKSENFYFPPKVPLWAPDE